MCARLRRLVRSSDLCILTPSDATPNGSLQPGTRPIISHRPRHHIRHLPHHGLRYPSIPAPQSQRALRQRRLGLCDQHSLRSCLLHCCHRASLPRSGFQFRELSPAEANTIAIIGWANGMCLTFAGCFSKVSACYLLARITKTKKHLVVAYVLLAAKALWVIQAQFYTIFQW